TRFLELRVARQPGLSAAGRIEHLGAYAVVRLVLETLARVPAAHAHVGAGIVAIRKARGAVAYRGWQPRLEEVRRLGHVRVGRNPLLAFDGAECLRRTVDIDESRER